MKGRIKVVEGRGKEEESEVPLYKRLVDVSRMTQSAFAKIKCIEYDK